jgi:hypothetical protein
MVPPEGMGVVGVKARVTGTEDLFMTLSDEAMLKPISPIQPDGAAVASSSSAVVRILTAPPSVTLPMVKPLIVTVNAEAPTNAPCVVIATEETIVAPQVIFKPATLLFPE